MKQFTFLIAFCALVLGGCSAETKQSIENDTQKNAEAASKQAKDAMAPVEDAAQNAAAATTLTPRLKAAITADSELNNDRNLINIDSNKDAVTIDGHVYSEALKSKAGAIVQAEMSKANAHQKVVNNLLVKGS